MRFKENGPDIPDELLLARDEGRVVFFCGSGVSKARANLPDFLGLAATVIDKLGTAKESPAYKLLNAAPALKEQTGIDNLFSSDRVFGFLEREFDSSDINSAVSSALKPKKKVDLSAHQILLNLATSDKTVKIITTNFDRLFEGCNSKLQTYQPPRLPDISNNEEINGVVYLHGCCNSEYTSAEGNGFVLSSSEFGRAYLADGWATRFYKAIIEKYVVVFIGYSADDPPVQYLLEAISKVSGQFKEVYAFQVGDKLDAVSKWAHKGIQAIPYKNDQTHSALWDTLSAWADRAIDTKNWYESTIKMSLNGPINLKPYERGQVAHIVSSTEGAKLFAKAEPPPPAEWLCVFDKEKRIEKSGDSGPADAREQFIPYDNYGLDSDVIPDDSIRRKFNQDKDPLITIWDCFAPNNNDVKESSCENFSSLKGMRSIRQAPLLPRMKEIANWLARVSHQPCAVWWASFQTGLHPEIMSLIDWNFRNKNDEQAKIVRKAWFYLEEGWKSSEDFAGSSYFSLKKTIDSNGWNAPVLRSFTEIHKPHIQVRDTYWRGPKPPNSETLNLYEIIQLEVIYQSKHSDINIPNEWLKVALELHRKNLELAVQLENEVTTYKFRGLAPIIKDENHQRFTTHSRSEGLSGYVIQYSELFQQYKSINNEGAKREFYKWSTEDDSVFCKLRIWAAGLPNFLTPLEFRSTFTQISEHAFWSSEHQRDLLLSLKSKWNDLPDKIKKTLEKRLLLGIKERYQDEDNHTFNSRRAWAALNRINWLYDQGCKFTFNIEDCNSKLLKKAPEWKHQHSQRSADSSVGRGGFVRTDINYDVLLNIPISEILITAIEHNGHRGDFLVENDPFSGLCKEKPIRTLCVLKLAARSNDYPVWAWNSFFNNNYRSDDSYKLSKLIASRILSVPDHNLPEILHIVVNWFGSVGQLIGSNSPEIFNALMHKFTRIIFLKSNIGTSSIVRAGDEIDWFFEAVNSPIGQLSGMLTDNPAFGILQHGKGLPNNWKIFTEELLKAPGDLKCYVVAVLSFNLRWFYSIDKNWVEINLISILKSKDDQAIDALWSGFLSGTQSHSIELYRRLKSNIVNFSKSSSNRSKADSEVIASILLFCWLSFEDKSHDRVLSSQEFRDIILKTDEDFKLTLLWQLKGWIRAHEKGNVKSEPINQRDELIIFFQEVWPLQISARTPNVSARLCDLAFSCIVNFPAVAEVIFPLLTSLKKNSHIHFNTEAIDNVFSNYPVQALKLLYKALPKDVNDWPYDVDAALIIIEESNPGLASDRRLVELLRLWSSR